MQKGGDLNQKRFCPMCGQANDGQSTFCMACGARLGYVPKAGMTQKPAKSRRRSRAFGVVFLLIVVAVIVAAVVVAVVLLGRGGHDGGGGGSTTQGGALKVALNDVYFEETNSVFWGYQSTLVVNVTLRNNGNATILLTSAYIQDSQGVVYYTDLISGSPLQPGQVASDLDFYAGDVPTNARGLKLVFRSTGGQATFSLPSSIRVEQS